MGKEKEAGEQAGLDLTSASDSLVAQANRPFGEINNVIMGTAVLLLVNFAVGFFWPHFPFLVSNDVLCWVVGGASIARILLRAVYGAIAQHLVASNALFWERTNIGQYREAMMQHHMQVQQQAAAHAEQVEVARKREALAAATAKPPTMRFSDFTDPNDDED